MPEILQQKSFDLIPGSLTKVIADGLSQLRVGTTTKDDDVADHFGV